MQAPAPFQHPSLGWWAHLCKASFLSEGTASTPVWLSPGRFSLPSPFWHLCAARWGLSPHPGGAEANRGVERGTSRAPTSPLPCPSAG